MYKIPSFLLGAGVGLGLALSLPKSSETPIQGFPSLEREGYRVVYDSRFKIPFFTYEKLTKNNVAGSSDRTICHFETDPSIYALHRSISSDFKGTKLDRGHLASAANHKSSQKELRETFYLSNICPQDPILNRGLWAKLEKHTRNLVKTSEMVEVFTGPLFIPQDTSDGRKVTFRVIGENDVAVPSHFYKVLRIWNQGRCELKCYVMPNISLSKDSSLEEFQYNASYIEKYSGLCFRKFD